MDKEKKVDVYYTYSKIITKTGLPLWVKFIKPINGKNIISLILSKDVSSDSNKLEALEKLLSNLFFIGLERADNDLVIEIESLKNI